MVSSCVDARMYLLFGENFTCDLDDGEKTSGIWAVRITYTIGESSSTIVFRHCPDVVSHIRLFDGNVRTRQKKHVEQKQTSSRPYHN